MDVCKTINIFLLLSLVLSTDAKENCQNGAKNKMISPSYFQESNGIDLLPNKTVCGIQNNDRIVGGVQTDLDEHPWTALVKYEKPKGNSFSCGGVLISSRYVMTAAHCIKNLPQTWRISQVRLGEWNLTSRTDCVGDDCSPDPLNVDIEEVIAHEKYNSTDGQQNDIALLRLVRDIPFTDFVKPICLPIDPQLRKNKFETYDMEVTGWGKTETKLHESNGIDLLPANNICGIQNNDRIVGGVLTDLDEHSWTALIKYDRPKGNAFFCGGVLISSRYVMTAAHCVQNLPQDWKLSQVRLGEWNLTSKTDCQLDDCSSDPLDVDIEEAIAHENYNSTKGQQNDIALLRLVRDIPFTDFVKPICLPIGLALKKKTFEGYDLVVAGWGKTETRSKSDIKLKVRVTVRNTQDCQDVYSRANRTISENQLCAGGLESQDSCRGDSGGALMGQVDVSKNWIALGVVSYGPSPCGTAGWPGVYTRVTSYVDWILSKIRP